MADLAIDYRPAGGKTMPWIRHRVATVSARREATDNHAGSGRASASGEAQWLCLAAAPTFAAMALITGISSYGAPTFLCSAMQHAPWLGGMVPMYVLMSAFHATPWLRLIGGRWRGGQGSSLKNAGLPSPGFEPLEPRVSPR